MTTKSRPAGKRGHARRHPGLALKLHLADLEMTATALAKMTGYTRKHISELLNGHTDFNPESAIKIARATGTTPDLWMNMQLAYSMEQAKQSLATWKPKRHEAA
ncbi:HigA family addiction module antitoxin [Pyruvatibacter mobilis]|uniref:HigA family addiction module antitoxin n=1 Tax=Pyruvatibacter mobilis TaxID=1712261 RepID=UPI003D103E63